MELHLIDRIFLRNPVLVKELRSRMRGGRTFVIASIYVSILCALIIFMIWLWSINFPAVRPAQSSYYAYQPYYGSSPYRSQAIIPSWYFSRMLFEILSYLQTLILCILTPAVTATTLTLEKEKGTLSLLLLTSIEPMKILTGKLQAAISFLLLMIFCSLPMMGIVFFLGGVSLWEILGVLLIQTIIVICFGMIGITYSLVCRHSAFANILSFLTIGFLCTGPLIFELYRNTLIYSQTSLWGMILAFVLTYIFLTPVAYGVYLILNKIYGKSKRLVIKIVDKSKQPLVSPKVKTFAGFGLVANLFCYFAYQPPWIDMVIGGVGTGQFVTLLFNPFIAIYSFLERSNITSYSFQINAQRGYLTIYGWIFIVAAYIVLFSILYFMNRRIISRYAQEK